MKSENFGAFLSSHYRPIMIVVGILIALCLGILIIVGVTQIKPPATYVEISVAPSAATIVLNGQEYRNGIYEIEPGTYHADISAAGFTPKNMDFTVEQGNTAKLSTYLMNINEGMDYYRRSQADLNILSTIDDPAAQSFIQDYNSKLSIRDQLPIDASYDMSAYYDLPGNEIYDQTVYDGSSDSRCQIAFCLRVSGYKLNEEALATALANLGYDINDYEVIYDFTR